MLNNQAHYKDHEDSSLQTQNPETLCKPIKVLQIASGDLWAGAEVQLLTLACYLHKMREVQVNIVLMNYGQLEQQLRKSGIRVYVIDEEKLSSFQILTRIHKLIKTINPDVVHTHRTKENILGSICALLSGNVPSLRTVHGAPEYRASAREISKQLINFLDWLCGRYIQKRIISVSDELSDRLLRHFPPNMVKVIENGIALDRANYQEENSLGRSEKTNRKIKIGLVGRLVPVKRVDIFLHIAKHIKEYHSKQEIEFLIYGDGPLFDELTAMSEALGVNDITHFKGHQNNMWNELQQLDILVMTSDHEGLPMAILEAMANGTVIVSHAVGGIPKLLDSGSCGILIKENSPENYASAIIELTGSPEIRDRLTEKALKRVTNSYSAKKNALSYLAEYLSICQKTGLQGKAMKNTNPLV